MVVDGSKSRDTVTTTVWDHAEFVWKCRNFFVEFVRQTDDYLAAFEEFRRDDDGVSVFPKRSKKLQLNKLCCVRVHLVAGNCDRYSPKSRN